MRKFKYIDTWISIILIFGFIMAGFIWQSETFITGYFVVGGWQVISMVIHSIKGWFTEKGGVRYGYQFAVAVIFALTLLGVIINPILFCVMVVMLFAAPFMAIFYAAICYKEVYVKMQRPLALLK